MDSMGREQRKQNRIEEDLGYLISNYGAGHVSDYYVFGCAPASAPVVWHPDFDRKRWPTVYDSTPRYWFRDELLAHLRERGSPRSVAGV